MHGTDLSTKRMVLQIWHKVGCMILFLSTNKNEVHSIIFSLPLSGATHVFFFFVLIIFWAGNAYCELRWASTSIPRIIIPSANLFVNYFVYYMSEVFFDLMFSMLCCILSLTLCPDTYCRTSKVRRFWIIVSLLVTPPTHPTSSLGHNTVLDCRHKNLTNLLKILPVYHNTFLFRYIIHNCFSFIIIFWFLLDLNCDFDCAGLWCFWQFTRLPVFVTFNATLHVLELLNSQRCLSRR